MLLFIELLLYQYTVEVEFYNFEFWTANNLQNEEIGCKSLLGHRGGASQRGFDGQISDDL